jgi:hypothetical protein
MRRVLVILLILLLLCEIEARLFYTFSLASQIDALDANQLSDVSLLATCDGRRETMPRVRVQLRNAFSRANADNLARVRVDLIGIACTTQRAADWSAVVPERDVRVAPFDLLLETTALGATLLANDTFVASSLFASTPDFCSLDCVRFRVRQSDDAIAPALVAAELLTIGNIRAEWMVNYTAPVIVTPPPRVAVGQHRWPADVSWRRSSAPPGFTLLTGPLLPHFVNTSIPATPLAQTGILAVREIAVEPCAGVWLRAWWETTGSASVALYYNGEIVLCAATVDTVCDDDLMLGTQVDTLGILLPNRTLATGAVFVGPRANNASGQQLLAARIYSAWAFDVAVEIDRSTCPSPPTAPPVTQFLLAQQQWRTLKAPYRASTMTFAGQLPMALRTPSALDGSLTALTTVSGFGNFSAAATAFDMVLALAIVNSSSALMRRPDCPRLRLIVHGFFPLLVLVNDKNVVCIGFDDCEREGVPRIIGNVRPDRVDVDKVVELGNGTVRIAVFSVEQFLRTTQVLLVATDPQNLRQCTGTCNDNVKNGDEDLVDCGGVCPVCMVQTLPPVGTTTPLPPLSPGETRAPTPPIVIDTNSGTPTAATAPTTTQQRSPEAPTVSEPSNVPLIVVAVIAGVLLLALIGTIMFFKVGGKASSAEEGKELRQPQFLPMHSMAGATMGESVGAYGSLPPPQSEGSAETYGTMAVRKDNEADGGVYAAGPVIQPSKYDSPSSRIFES